MSLVSVHYLSMVRSGRLDEATSPAYVGDEVTFTVSSLDASQDFVIDWGDEDTSYPSSDGDGIVSATHTYGDDGSYDVSVSQDYGDGRTVYRYTFVVQQKTGADITPLDALIEGDDVGFNFTGMSSGAYLRVDWGDESEDYFTSDGAGEVTGSHTYNQYGDYTITITDDDHQTVIVGSLDITVDHRIGNMDWDSTPVVAGAEAVLNGTDFAFNRNITIDWGDEETNTFSTSGSGGFAAGHTYALDGNYTVTALDGEFALTTLNVTVDPSV